MNAAPRLFSVLLALAAPLAGAQTASSGVKLLTPAIQTIYVKNATQANDLNEILTTVRNMLPPSTRIYSVSQQNAIVLEGTEEQFQLARQIIDSLDLPKKSYHLTYTVAEFDGDKRLSTQHISMHLVSGQPATLKQGSRIPIVTNSTSEDTAHPVTQYAYVDVGLLISATVNGIHGGASLRTKVEQSSVATERTSPSIQDPNIRQSSLESVSMLSSGKPAVLGSVDLPGTTHHLEIEALLEPQP